MGLSMQIATLVYLKFVRGLFFLSFLFFYPDSVKGVGWLFVLLLFLFLFYTLVEKRDSCSSGETMLIGTVWESMMCEGMWRKQRLRNIPVTQDDIHTGPRQYSSHFSILKYHKYNAQHLIEHLFLPRRLGCVIWWAALYLTSWWLDCWKKL